MSLQLRTTVWPAAMCSAHMAEIKNIIPGDEELYAYYREDHPDPALRDFDGFEDIEKAAQRFGCKEYLCKVDAIVFDGLKWMNNLDRNHPFWTGTNVRPTIYKLFDFARMIHNSEPDNLRALWLLAVEDTFTGANDFGQEWWLRLWQMGSLDVRWPIWAGLWNEMMLGFGDDLVGRLLRQMGSPPEGRDYLAEIATARNARLREWAAKQVASGY